MRGVCEHRRENKKNGKKTADFLPVLRAVPRCVWQACVTFPWPHPSTTTMRKSVGLNGNVHDDDDDDDDGG